MSGGLRRKASTLLIEFAVGFVVVIGAVLYATYGPFSWVPHRKWLTLAIISFGVWGVPLWWYRDLWNRVSFWVATALLVAAHCVAYCIFLVHVKEFPPVLSKTCWLLEWLVIFPILRRTARRETSAPK